MRAADGFAAAALRQHMTANRIAAIPLQLRHNPLLHNKNRFTNGFNFALRLFPAHFPYLVIFVHVS